MYDIPLMAVQEAGLEFLPVLEQLACKVSALAYVGFYPALSNPYCPKQPNSLRCCFSCDKSPLVFLSISVYSNTGISFLW